MAFDLGQYGLARRPARFAVVGASAFLPFPESPGPAMVAGIRPLSSERLNRGTCLLFVVYWGDMRDEPRTLDGFCGKVERVLWGAISSHGC